MKINKIDLCFGKNSKNLLNNMNINSEIGALAGLETFYYSFNNKNIEVFKEVWVNHELIQLNNPIGGIIRGIDAIIKLYSNIFKSDAGVWVEFYDIISYSFDNIFVFAGRERGEFKKNGKMLKLDIRTTRIFAYINGKWGQIHHHGSIDDSNLLLDYQNSIKTK